MALSVPPARRESVDIAESWQVCRIRGDLDCTRADLLRAYVDAALEPPVPGGAPRIALHLAEVPFCDSYGLSALVYAAKRLRAAGGALRVTSASRQVRSLIRRCGLDCLLPLPD
ncbi:STAS domain-containing protein [Actinomadura rayongensis]|uniref:Anti-sigma factor antagonist n=1 Tax=Actinomadura rayongensis TaxID=1429076 RepID=A0A6I4W859_9ACTN|nr:STAS domain-containing protein [Actinomadura rayongensis]MXQ66909.1 anti-sigma factor antagonist [Actinomadura rayongensis]